jgi:hypothetical protein
LLLLKENDMPNRWPIASGNWSDAAIWSGSLIPTASDDVFLNNQTVTLDQNVTVASIRNINATGVAAGGQLNIYGDYNITATPNGITGSSAITNGMIQYYNSGSITIQSSIAASRQALGNISTGTINIVGNILGSTIIGVATVLNISAGTINVIGNLTGGISGGSIAISNLLNGTINLTGNITPGFAGFGINNASAGTVNVTGNTIGGTSTTSHGINNASIGTVNVTGTVTAGTSTGTGINSTTAGIINVIGQLQASTTANAVSSTSTTATNIFSGPLINSGSRNAIYCYNVQMYDDVTTRYTIGVSGSNNTITLFSPDQVTGVPSGSDVRVGTIYGPGNELTGSMAVPHPNSVSYGVAVDQTTGVALTKPEDLWNIALIDLTSSNSIGQRLASTATSASNAAIVNAFG